MSPPSRLGLRLIPRSAARAKTLLSEEALLSEGLACHPKPEGRRVAVGAVIGELVSAAISLFCGKIQ